MKETDSRMDNRRTERYTEEDNELIPIGILTPIKNGRGIKIALSVIFLILAVVSVIMISKGCAGEKEAIPQGRYYIDGYTSYEFSGDGNGALCLGEKKRYSFTYTADETTLKIDFTDDAVPDVTYTYTLDSTGYTLTITNPTSGSFTMMRDS